METDSESLGFLAERVVMKRSRAEKEGFKIPEDYSVTLPDFLKDRDESCLESDKKSDLIIIWEYHDLEEDRIYWVLQDDSTEFPTDYAREPVDQPNPFEGSPYVPLVFNEDNDDVIGMSDVEPVEKQALAINRIRTKQTRHVDGFGTVVHYEEDSIEPKELSKTTDTDHGKYVKVKKGRLGALHVSGTPSMGNDNYNMDSVHKEDMRTTLGITDYQQGGADSRKATEAQIITNAANVRIMERRDVIYDFVIECVRRLSALIQTFSEEEEFLNVADMEFGEDFVDYLKNDYGFNPEIPFLRMKREDIQGEYNFKFSIEDMIVRPKEVQAQQFLQFLGLMGNPTMTAAAQEEGISLGKIFVKASELLDVDLEELKEGGPIQIPPLKENMMFKQGMEIPDPHKKDKHDEHMLIHNPVIQEITQSGQQLMQAKQQITMQIEQIRAAGEGMVVDHEGEQMAAQKMQEIDQQLQSMQLMLRRVKVHMQHHSQMQNAKSMQGMGGGQQPNPQAPNPNQSAQVGINAAARRGANAGV